MQSHSRRVRLGLCTVGDAISLFQLAIWSQKGMHTAAKFVECSLESSLQTENKLLI